MFRSRLIGATLMVAGLAVAGGPEARATEWNADVVIEWNQLLQATLPGTAALLGPRYYSMMHIAMFDAANAIERDYAQYRVRIQHASGSSQAAAAQAAHDVLTALIGSKPEYDDLLAQQLSEADGCRSTARRRCGKRRSSFVERGASIGAKVAEQILDWRQNDGWVVAVVPAYKPPSLPGLWQSTPNNFPTATFTHLQGAAPMALLTATQFLPAPPPMLDSELYATDFNEVKAIGRSTGSTRTPDQTDTARLWAGVATSGAMGATATNLFSIWNNIVRDVTVERGLSLVETARLFVLVNVSIHDSLQTTQTSKFVYGLWRPVTAIRNADTDLNPATDPDTAWLALLVNPPYPEYGGNMAGVGASAATALALALGTNDIPVSATWRQSDGPDVTHDFPGFWQVAEEQSMSRIYGGIHYRFAQVAGQTAGRNVAEFVFANYMAPRKSWDD